MAYKLDTKQQAKVIESLQRRLEDAIANGEKLTWNSFLTQIGAYVNPSTGRAYEGWLNGVLLAFTSMAFDGDPRFVGYGQARKMGGPVKKGEKGTPIFRPMIVDKKDDDGEAHSAMVGYRQVIVFNVRQTTLIENGRIPAKVVENVNADAAPIASVIDFANCIDFEQVASTGCPYYSPIADNIGMPEFSAFHNAPAHADALLHELIHWTGSTKRLARITPGWTNKADYSKEELVACMGSALMLNHLGVSVSDEAEINMTAYLQGWISFLKNDIGLLLDAAQDAATAANYLIKLSEGQIVEGMEVAA